jgi:hypothetical protein
VTRREPAVTRRELAVLSAAAFYLLLYIVCAVLIIGNLRDAPTPTTWHTGDGDAVEVHP